MSTELIFHGSRARIEQPRFSEDRKRQVTEVVTGRSLTRIALSPGIITTAAISATAPEAGDSLLTPAARDINRDAKSR